MGANDTTAHQDALATHPAPNDTSAHQDALATHPAPVSSGSFTVVPIHTSEELRELQRAIRRLVLLGMCVWPSFFFFDFLGACADAAGDHAIWLVGWRLLGVLLGAIAYFTVRDAELRMGQLHAIDASVFAIGSVLLTLIAIPFGGLTSRFVQGVTVFVFARAALIPSHWTRALAVSLLATSMLPVTMAAVSPFDAALRAQWASPHAVLVFLHNGSFVLVAAVTGSFGSHIVWMARRQVHELRKLGSYRLRSRIGIGGVGEVWRAWQDPPGREVAIKVLKGAALEEPDAVKRFDREARAAAHLTHPNTIRVFDYGATEDGVRYIAMELLHGLNLDAVVRSYGPMPAARVIYLARQACGSLAEAHAKGIIHRDLKPANLFVSRDEDGNDVLTVLDFGLARILPGGASASSPSPLTPEGVICGTPAFMSPEAVSGEAIDARSDIYSLGAVLYFMVTNTVVFPHLTISESLLAHAGRPPEPPSKRLAGVPADLERVILRCLEKRPDDRYPSAETLDAALAKCADAGKWARRDAFAFWNRAIVHDRSMTRLVSP